MEMNVTCIRELPERWMMESWSERDTADTHAGGMTPGEWEVTKEVITQPIFINAPGRACH